MTKRCTTDTQEKTYDNPQTKLWSMYLTEVEKHDQALVESWKGDMDGILIFVRELSALSKDRTYERNA